MTDIEKMKIVLRESDIPFFDDETLQFYINENNGNLNNAIYQCLLIKSENTSLSISGLSAADSSSYFKRLASRYRPNNSGIIKGG